MAILTGCKNQQVRSCPTSLESLHFDESICRKVSLAEARPCGQTPPPPRCGGEAISGLPDLACSQGAAKLESGRRNLPSPLQDIQGGSSFAASEKKISSSLLQASEHKARPSYLGNGCDERNLHCSSSSAVLAEEAPEAYPFRGRLQRWLFSLDLNLEKERSEASEGPSSAPFPSSPPSVCSLMLEVAAFSLLQSRRLSAFCVFPTEGSTLLEGLPSLSLDGERPPLQRVSFCFSGGGAPPVPQRVPCVGVGGYLSEECSERLFLSLLREEGTSTILTRPKGSSVMASLAVLAFRGVHLQALASSRPGDSGFALSFLDFLRSWEGTADQTGLLNKPAPGAEAGEKQSPTLSPSCQAPLVEAEATRQQQEEEVNSLQGLALEEASTQTEALLLCCSRVVQEAAFFSALPSSEACTSTSSGVGARQRQPGHSETQPESMLRNCVCLSQGRTASSESSSSSEEFLSRIRDTAQKALESLRLALLTRPSKGISYSEPSLRLHSELTSTKTAAKATGESFSQSQGVRSEGCPARESPLKSKANFQELQAKNFQTSSVKMDFRLSPRSDRAESPQSGLQSAASAANRCLLEFCQVALFLLPPPHLLLWRGAWIRRRAQEETRLSRPFSFSRSADETALQPMSRRANGGGGQETLRESLSSVFPFSARHSTTAKRESSSVAKNNGSGFPPVKASPLRLQNNLQRQSTLKSEETEGRASLRVPTVKLVAHGAKRQKLEEDATEAVDKSARGRWSAEETKAFVEAVNIEGVGQWRVIARLYSKALGRRTNRQLKDKWLNLLSHNHVAEKSSGGLWMLREE